MLRTSWFVSEPETFIPLQESASATCLAYSRYYLVWKIESLSSDLSFYAQSHHLFVVGAYLRRPFSFSLLNSALCLFRTTCSFHRRKIRRDEDANKCK